MMTTRHTLYLTIAALLLGLSACKYSNKIETIKVKDEFSMTIPEYLKEAENLKAGADFQYSNKFRNMYVVVFSEKKTGTLQDFYDKQTNIIKQVLDKPAIDDSTEVKIEGGHGVYISLAGKMQGEMIYYNLLTIEAKDKYYQAAIWTRSEDRKLKYSKDMEQIIMSFRLLHP
jgi:hypothetical protein